MYLLNSACYVFDDTAEYIFTLSFQDYYPSVPDLDGNEITVHNGTTYPAAGGVGIPPVNENNFHIVYTK